jgi:K+-sensing histidine kinase KdpD
MSPDRQKILCLDGRRLTQALMQPFENAVTHTAVGPDQHRRGRGLADSRGVDDAGSGVPEADRSVTFERFPTRTSRGGLSGAGLGSAIVSTSTAERFDSWTAQARRALRERLAVVDGLAAARGIRQLTRPGFCGTARAGVM